MLPVTSALLSAPTKHSIAHLVTSTSRYLEVNPTPGYESTRLLRDSLNSSGESGPARTRKSGITSGTRGGIVTVAISSSPWFRNQVSSIDSARRSAHKSISSRSCFRRLLESAKRLSMASSIDFFEAVSRNSTAISSCLSGTFTILRLRGALTAGFAGPDTNTQVANVRTTCFGGYERAATV
jgi:hypothetical protein